MPKGVNMKKLFMVLALFGIIACLYAETQYDYLAIRVVAGSGGGGTEGIYSCTNYKEAPVQIFFERNSLNLKKVSMNELLAAAGKEGWKLVGQSELIAQGFAILFIFMKEKGQ
jgi:hypothetical protein